MCGIALVRICQVQHSHVVLVTTLPVRKAQAAPTPQPAISLWTFVGTSRIMQGLQQSFAECAAIVERFYRR